VRVISVAPKLSSTCLAVEDESVSSELDSVHRAIAQAAHEGLLVLTGTLANQEH